MSTITLKGKDVTAGMTIRKAPKPNKNGVEYYIGRLQGKGFTTDEEFYEAWKAGKIQEATFTEASYNREIADSEETISTPSWNLDGYMTTDQYKAYLTNQVDVRGLEVKVDLIEKKALADLKLSEQKIRELEEHV